MDPARFTADFNVTCELTKAFTVLSGQGENQKKNIS
jgi:hypothetical protein